MDFQSIASSTPSIIAALERATERAGMGLDRFFAFGARGQVVEGIITLFVLAIVYLAIYVLFRFFWGLEEEEPRIMGTIWMATITSIGSCFAIYFLSRALMQIYAPEWVLFKDLVDLAR